MSNPLLIPFLLPPFSYIRPEHVIPAVKKAINDCRETVENIVAQGKPYTHNNLCQRFEEVNDVLSRIVSTVNHLNSVKSNLKLREVYQQTLLLLSEYSAWIGQHKGLYQAYRDLRDGKYFSELDMAQRKSVNNILRDFELAGINLNEEKKKRYSEVIACLAKLADRYSNNVFDSTVGWTKLITDVTELAGVPKSVLATIKGEQGYILTLDYSNYLPVITYCDNKMLRKEIYYAYNTRASDQGPNALKWDNGPVMEDILALRYELAQLLGFENYAQRSLATKMAKNPEYVLDFLNNLVKRVRPQAKRELEKLQTFVKEKFGVHELYPWDISYYSEKQKEYLYDIQDEQLRPYFPDKKVINGFFNLIKCLYGVFVQERHDVDVWDSDVRFFELYNENQELLGSFYLDLYVRKNKRDGAWMDDCISQMRRADGALRKPVAYIIGNVSRSINSKMALLTHNEVITLFHEFGHGLHHILTSVETLGVSGINGVPWDAVELPSQFMEKWCWEPDVLALISGHYKTGAPLPKIFLNKMMESKNYQVAMSILRQLELSLFDFYLHCEYDPNHRTTVLEKFLNIKKKIALIVYPSWGRFPNAFSHIFSGGYAAGYYSYLWANVLASDAYSRFKEEGIFNRSIGQSFLDNILTRGGSEEPMDLFKRFRGREPQLDKMLENYGIE